MAYGYQGVCYASQDDAYNAFILSFPRESNGGNGWESLVSSSISGQKITYSLRLDTGSVKNGNVELISTCTPNSPADAVLFITACIGAFFTGWLTRKVLKTFNILVGGSAWD